MSTLSILSLVSGIISGLCALPTLAELAADYLFHASNVPVPSSVNDVLLESPIGLLIASGVLLVFGSTAVISSLKMKKPPHNAREELFATIGLIGAGMALSVPVVFALLYLLLVFVLNFGG